MVSRRLAKNGWNLWHGVACAVVVLLSVAATWRGWFEMVTLGLSRALVGYIFLVPLVAGWLFWVRRKRFAFCHPTGAWAGLLVALVGAVCYVVGQKQGLAMLMHLGAVLMPVGSVVAVLGHEVLLAYLPAFAALLALTPPPLGLANAVALPLQVATARMTCGVYAVMGASAEYVGGDLRIGDSSVPLQEVCDGLPMALTLAVICYGFVFGTPLRGSVRMGVLLLSPVAAVLFNAVALVATFWLWSYLPVQRADWWHRLSEWVMLLLAFFSLLACIRLLAWASVPVRPYTLAQDRSPRR